MARNTVSGNRQQVQQICVAVLDSERGCRRFKVLLAHGVKASRRACRGDREVRSMIVSTTSRHKCGESRYSLAMLIVTNLTLSMEHAKQERSGAELNYIFRSFT